MPMRNRNEFEGSVVVVARRGNLTVSAAATVFGVAEETIRSWVRPANIDEFIKDGIAMAEWMLLRRLTHRLGVGNMSLRRAGAHFTSSMLPRRPSRWSVTGALKDHRFG